MDTSSTLAGGGIVATIVLVGGIIYKAINHKHLRSRCMGQTLDVSIDIDDSTPAPTTVKVEVPMSNIKVPSVRKMSVGECPTLAKPTTTSHPSDQS